MIYLSIEFLLNTAIILLIGFICSSIANRLRLPHSLPLIIGGMLLNLIHFKGIPLIQMPTEILFGFATIALCIAAFDASSRFRIKHLTQDIKITLKLTAFTAGLNIIFLTPTIQALFFSDGFTSLNIWLGSLVLAVMMSEVSLDNVSISFQKVKNRAVCILENESIINTPILLILAFIILDLSKAGSTILVASSYIMTHIALSICSALLVGIIFFRFMRGTYSEIYSPFALIVGVLLSYVLAVMTGGNGFIAASLVGLFFGRVYIEKKTQLQEFSSVFAVFLEMFVYLLLGLTISMRVDLSFMLFSLIIYVAILFIRFIAVQLSLGGIYTLQEKLFMTVNTPKGISIAALALFLSFFSSDMVVIVDLSVMLILFSTIAHSFLMWSKEEIK